MTVSLNPQSTLVIVLKSVQVRVVVVKLNAHDSQNLSGSEKFVTIHLGVSIILSITTQLRKHNAVIL